MRIRSSRELGALSGRSVIAAAASFVEYPRAVSASIRSVLVSNCGVDTVCQSSLPFNSSTIRLAVFVPTPETPLNASGFPAVIAMDSSFVVNVESIPSASLGPTPLMLIKASNADRVSSIGNPYNVRLSSRTCSEVNSFVISPVRPIKAVADPGIFARIVTPPTEMSTQSGPIETMVPSIPVITEIYSCMFKRPISLELMWHIATARASAASLDGVASSSRRTRIIA